MILPLVLMWTKDYAKLLPNIATKRIPDNIFLGCTVRYEHNEGSLRYLIQFKPNVFDFTRVFNLFELSETSPIRGGPSSS